MFKVDDYIIYGSNGVCQVKDICTPQGMDENKKYYELEPIYLKETTIFTPVDNVNVVMRNIISKEETEQLIRSISTMETVEINDAKTREEKCKNALRTCDYIEWAKVILTLSSRKKEQMSLGKKLGQADKRLLDSALEYLHGELAVALNIPKEDVENYIAERIEQLEHEM